MTERLVSGWADAVWDMGRAFGTIGCRKGPWQVEITTYRSETYDPDVPQARRRLRRQPRPATWAGGTSRVNSMAVRVPGREFVDPFGGIVDLAERVLRTPGQPEDSFSDDPLRMMRAARFAAQLGFAVAPEVVAAMTAMAGRIEIISAERVRDELVKLVCAPHPRLGLTLLVETGLAGARAAGAARPRARARRAPPPQGRLRAHAHGARAVDRPRAPARRRPRLRRPVRRADARRRQAEDPALRVAAAR